MVDFCQFWYLLKVQLCHPLQWVPLLNKCASSAVYAALRVVGAHSVLEIEVLTAIILHFNMAKFELVVFLFYELNVLVLHGH